MPYKDPEKEKEWRKKYYLLNKDKVQKYHKKYRDTHPEIIKKKYPNAIKKQQIKKDNFYLAIINKHLKGTIDESIAFLISIHGNKKNEILKRITDTEKEQIILKMKYNEQQIEINKQIDKQIKSQMKRQLSKIRNKNKQKIKFNNNKKFIQNILENSPCECGEKNTNKLEFHHIDPSKKTRESTRDLCKRSLDKIKEELKYCKVLCRNCHTILHNNKLEDHIANIVRLYFKHRTQKRYHHK